MTTISRSLFLFCFFVCILSVSSIAHAECGGNIQCIGVGPTQTAASLAHHGNGPDTFTLGFDVQAINTTSASKTIYVAAVGGAVSGTATLGALTITGADAASFVITSGGTCPTNGGAGPTHNGAQCTILVAFSPKSLGAKTAILHVPLNPPCGGCITERIVTLSGSDFNPGNDAGVVGVQNSQSQVSKRFAQAQISNFQQRMESLHRPGTTTGSSRSGNSAFTPSKFNGGSEAAAAVSGQRLSPSPLLPAGQSGTAGAETTTNPETNALLDKLLSLATSGSTRLAYSNNATETSTGAGGAGSELGFWFSGNVGFGTRAQTSDSNNLQFATEGISIGIDKRYSDKLTLGMGMGYARDRTLIGSDGSTNKASGNSITGYGSYQPTGNTFVDALLGYSVLGHDTDRYVAAASDFARSHRAGQQWFGAITTGYEHRKENLLLSPYGRFDFSLDQLGQTAETGGGTGAITYFEQTQRAMRLSLGLRAEASHATSFGKAMPYVRVEYNHDLSAIPQSTMIYNNQSTGPLFTTSPALTSGNNAILLGLGSDFLLRSGLKLGIDYQTQRTAGLDNNQAIRFWMSKELDGKGDLNNQGSSSGLLPANLFDNPVRIEAGFSRDDNINRAGNGSDKLMDNTYSFNVNKSTFFTTSEHTRLLMSGFIGGDKQQQYEGLDRFSGGVQGELQYRTSGVFDATTYGLFTRATLDQYKSKLRAGNRISIGISARQTLTERLALFSTLSNNIRNAENNVFSTRDKSLRVNLDYRQNRSATVYLSGEYRIGDTVSTSIPAIHSAAIADVIVEDDAFGLVERDAYRFAARTTLLTLGYNMALGSRDSVDLFWRRVDTISTREPDYSNLPPPYTGLTGPGGPAIYISNQIGIAYLMRF